MIKEFFSYQIPPNAFTVIARALHCLQSEKAYYPTAYFPTCNK